MPPDYEHGSYQHAHTRELVQASCMSPSRPSRCCFGEVTNLKAVNIEYEDHDVLADFMCISGQSAHYHLTYTPKPAPSKTLGPQQY